MPDAILTVESLTKQYGERLLFENISFGISEGQKTALVARNGYGKSTLMNIIMGHELPDAGRVTFRAGARVAHLPQSLPLPPGQRVRDFVFHNLHRPDGMESWDFEQKVEEVLSRLEIGDLDKEVTLMSGGEQKKMALARILIDDTDLLLLDEPTNHLDIAMIEWLERFLSRQRLALLMVTHDRYFLDNVCGDILEIDNATLFHYNGTYAYYMQKKAERELDARAEVARAKSLYRTEKEWMSRMPQARGTKAKARIDAFYDLEAKARTRFEEDKAEISVKTERMGGKVLEAYNISHAFGSRVLIHDFSYLFRRGDKVGIVGPNGIGKSTLLRILTQELKPDSGHVEVGQTIRFGIYSQGGLAHKDDQRVIDIVKEEAEVIELDGGKKMSAHQFLSYFGFDDTTQYNFFGNLSGGERRRLYLLKVLMSNPNFLILDEPTNDLDLYTLELLERFLVAYKGCVLIVSHDRSFMDDIVGHTFAFEGDGLVRDFPGNYTQYRAYAEQRQKEATAKKREERPARERTHGTTTRRATYKEQKEYEALTADIAALTAERAALETLLSSGQETDPHKITAAARRIGDIIHALDDKELRWLELDEIVNPR